MDDLSYFQRRTAQERAATLWASHPGARQAHAALAQEYENLIRHVAASERPLNKPIKETIDA